MLQNADFSEKGCAYTGFL